MSRMSDQQKWNERNRAVSWRHAPKIRANPKKLSQMVCSECGVYPCANTEDCRRSRGKLARISIYKCPCGKTSTKQGKIKRHMKRMQKKGRRGHG